jgi:hypothetical protein
MVLLPKDFASFLCLDKLSNFIMSICMHGVMCVCPLETVACISVTCIPTLFPSPKLPSITWVKSFLEILPFKLFKKSRRWKEIKWNIFWQTEVVSSDEYLVKPMGFPLIVHFSGDIMTKHIVLVAM